MNHQMQMDPDSGRLTEQLKRAARSEAAPPYLDARIRNTIRASENARSWTRRLVPVGATAAVCLGVTIAYQLWLTTSSEESYIASVSNQVATLMRVGLGDHIHCSVFRKFSNDGPKVEDLAQTIGPEYSPLIPIVREQVPRDLRMVIAHECRYHARKFVHISAKSDSQLLSLIIARKRDGESFAIENLTPALAQSGITLYRAGVQRFEIASFESRDHLVYLVSDFDQRKNMQMLVAMAPQLKEFLGNREL